MVSPGYVIATVTTTRRSADGTQMLRDDAAVLFLRMFYVTAFHRLLCLALHTIAELPRDGLASH